MRILCFKLKPIKIALLGFVAVVLAICMFLVTETQTVFFGYSARKVPIYYVSCDSKKVSITFDAAWGADKTKQIVDICKKYKIKCTFFLVGFWVEKYSDEVRYIKENGMEIGTHSNTHPKMTTLSESGMRSELDTSIKLIQNITNDPVVLFRPPFGDYNDKLVSVCETMNLKPIQWDVDSLDWKGLSASEIIQRVTSSVKNGSIILCHNNSDHIVEALPSLIEILQSKGYEFVSVGDLTKCESYSVDNNGMMIKK